MRTSLACGECRPQLPPEPVALLVVRLDRAHAEGVLGHLAHRAAPLSRLDRLHPRLGMGLRPGGGLQEDIRLAECRDDRFGKLSPVDADRRDHDDDRGRPHRVGRAAEGLGDPHFIGIGGDQDRFALLHPPALHALHGALHHLHRARRARHIMPVRNRPLFCTHRCISFLLCEHYLSVLLSLERASALTDYPVIPANPGRLSRTGTGILLDTTLERRRRWGY